jgi:hypothetical protein
LARSIGVRDAGADAMAALDGVVMRINGGNLDRFRTHRLMLRTKGETNTK